MVRIIEASASDGGKFEIKVSDRTFLQIRSDLEAYGRSIIVPCRIMRGRFKRLKPERYVFLEPIYSDLAAEAMKR